MNRGHVTELWSCDCVDVCCRLHGPGNEHSDPAPEHCVHGHLPATAVLPPPTVSRRRDGGTPDQTVHDRLQGHHRHTRPQDGHT